MEQILTSGAGTHQDWSYFFSSLNPLPPTGLVEEVFNVDAQDFAEHLFRFITLCGVVLFPLFARKHILDFC